MWYRSLKLFSASSTIIYSFHVHRRAAPVKSGMTWISVDHHFWQIQKDPPGFSIQFPIDKYTAKNSPTCPIISRSYNLFRKKKRLIIYAPSNVLLANYPQSSWKISAYENKLTGNPRIDPRDYGGSRLFPFPAKKITAEWRGPPQ